MSHHLQRLKHPAGTSPQPRPSLCFKVSSGDSSILSQLLSCLPLFPGPRQSQLGIFINLRPRCGLCPGAVPLQRRPVSRPSLPQLPRAEIWGAGAQKLTGWVKQSQVPASSGLTPPSSTAVNPMLSSLASKSQGLQGGHESPSKPGRCQEIFCSFGEGRFSFFLFVEL